MDPAISARILIAMIAEFSRFLREIACSINHTCRAAPTISTVVAWDWRASANHCDDTVAVQRWRGVPTAGEGERSLILGTLKEVVNPRLNLPDGETPRIYLSHRPKLNTRAVASYDTDQEGKSSTAHSTFHHLIRRILGRDLAPAISSRTHVYQIRAKNQLYLKAKKDIR